MSGPSKVGGWRQPLRLGLLSRYTMIHVSRNELHALAERPSGEHLIPRYFATTDRDEYIARPNNGLRSWRQRRSTREVAAPCFIIDVEHEVDTR